jgi:hypothetical protein
MDASSSGVPADLLSEGVATVDAEGGLTPCNEAMRKLLRSVARDGRTVLALADLPLPSAAHSQLAAGLATELRFVDERHEVRLVRRGEQAWLLSRDLSAAAMLLTTRQASARARMLGDLAATVMHDLANLLAAGMGVAEVLRPHVKLAEDLTSLEDLLTSARQGVTLGRGLARMLARGPRAATVRSLADVIEEVVAVLGKHCRRRDVELTKGAIGDASVRLESEEVMDVLVHAVLFGLDHSARAIHVGSSAASRVVAGGRTREVGCVVVVLHGLPRETCLAACDIVAGAVGALPIAHRLGEHAVGLLQAAMTLAAGGGEFSARENGGDLQLDFAWPIVRRAND